MDNIHVSKDEDTHPSRGASEEPPPAYEDLSRPASIFSALTDATLPEDSAPIPGRPFPVVFSVYYKRVSWKTTFYQLGEHADQPCNAVTLTTGWKGTNLTLHQSADPDSPPIALAGAENTFGRHSLITLPGLPGTEETETEQLRTNMQRTTLSYTFAVKVTRQGEKPVPENFEWRLSHGSEVRSLDKYSWGWKLVRLRNGDTAERLGGKRNEREMGETSDGKEIVAVFALLSKASTNKMGKFQFFGSGAAGDLGDKWAIMAVVTLLRIWQNLRLGSTGGSSFTGLMNLTGSPGPASISGPSGPSGPSGSSGPSGKS